MSSQYLLFGSNCFKNVTAVARTLKRTKCKEVEEYFRTKISRYHPLFFSREIFRQLDKYEVEKISNLSIANCGQIEGVSFRSTFFRKFNLSRELFHELENINMIWANNELEVMEELQKARELLKLRCSWLIDVERKVVDDIWPVKLNDQVRFSGGCCSDPRLLGLVFVSIRPESAFAIEDLAIAYAHEIGHQVVMVYQSGMLPVDKVDWNKEIYSGIKKSNRPVYLSLHGAVALGYMLHVTKQLRLNSNQDEKLDLHLSIKQKRYEEALGKGLEAFGGIKMTKLGDAIIEDLNKELVRVAAYEIQN